jgi:adenylate kinase family enzyme
MPTGPARELLEDFQQTLVDCRRLYLDGGRRCARDYPDLIRKSPEEFLHWMDDLHKGLVVKVYMDVALADQRWRPAERILAQLLVEHVWQRHLEGDALREAARGLSERARQLRLFSLIRPFAEIAPLRDSVGELQTVVMRLANLIAKADCDFSDSEARRLRSLHEELQSHLAHLPLDATSQHESRRSRSRQAVRRVCRDAQQIHQDCALAESTAAEPPRSAEERLRQTLAELDRLVGLAAVKQEIRTLTNYLKLQRHREQAGLPRTSLSLHMVFAGNPGTGKTTVARIVAEIFGAMGILKKGHLIETDRSGLVAEYAGQTGPKTNALIDQAIDGVLFIDEAYSLVADQTDDAFGREALQALMKRMEDERSRLVVILAGYSRPMQRLLHANPGLSSRFGRTLQFSDYEPIDLGRIFQRMCDANHYQIPAAVRHRLLFGFRWLYEQRDEHFGNGRLARNLFEDAIRRLANRVANATPVTRQLLTELQTEDLPLPEVPKTVWDEAAASASYRIVCPQCQRKCSLPPSLLGSRVRCRRCRHEFLVDWAAPPNSP